jgi:hypothetical protein
MATPCHTPLPASELEKSDGKARFHFVSLDQMTVHLEAFGKIPDEMGGIGRNRRELPETREGFHGGSH